VDLVGTANLMNIFQAQKAAFQGEPHIRRVQQTKLGTLVLVRSNPPGPQPAGNSSYLLRKVGGEWVVAYDSSLADGVASLVTTAAQNRINRRATQPSAKAIAAGKRAARRLRALVLKPTNGRLGA
jgi:hypothetical protein